MVGEDWYVAMPIRLGIGTDLDNQAGGALTGKGGAFTRGGGDLAGTSSVTSSMGASMGGRVSSAFSAQQLSHWQQLVCAQRRARFWGGIIEASLGAKGSEGEPFPLLPESRTRRAFDD